MLYRVSAIITVRAIFSDNLLLFCSNGCQDPVEKVIGPLMDVMPSPDGPRPFRPPPPPMMDKSSSEEKERPLPLFGMPFSPFSFEDKMKQKKAKWECMDQIAKEVGTAHYLVNYYIFAFVGFHSQD